MIEIRHKNNISASSSQQTATLVNVTVDPEKFLQPVFLSCSGVGFPAGLFWLCGVLLHPVGEEPGDPAEHGLSAQPHHTQYDCGKYGLSTHIYPHFVVFVFSAIQ